MNRKLSKVIGIMLVFALIHSVLPMAAFAESATVSISPTTCTNNNIDILWSDFPVGSGIIRYEWSATSASEGFDGNNITSTETSGSSSLDLPEGQGYVWLRAVYSGEEYGDAIQSQEQYNRDETNPSVSITAPTSGAAINGAVPILGSVSDDNMDEWILEYGEGTAPSTWTQISNGNSEIIDDTLGNWDTGSITEGTYTLRLSANDLAGNSPTPATVQVIIDNDPPTVPTDLTSSSITGNEVTLTWSASTDNVGVAGYIVYRNGSEVGTTSDTTFADTGLSDNTTYTYTVLAEDTEGNQSSLSEALEVTTLDATAPDKPTGLTCDSMTGTSISISWDASDDNVAVTEYDVYRDGARISTTSDTSLTDTGLSGNTIYGYTIVAKDAEGNVSDESKTLYAAISTDIFAISNNEDMLTITWYGGTDTEVHIPAMIGGNTVSGIGDWAFCDCPITQVTIPDTITSIGTEAFAGCGDLYSITIPGSVISIGEGTFGGCCSLEEVVFENGVTAIGNGAFYECSSLMDITIPESVTSIGNSSFECCYSLETVVIENGMSSIGEWAFSDCGSLLEITIPDSVASIGDGAFYGCCSLASIAVPSGVTRIGDSTFEGCGSLESIILPDSVTSIGDWAFSGCSYFTEVTIPDNVVSIGDGAFYDCSSLINITIPGNVSSISNDTFQNCYGLENATIQNGVTSIGDGAFYECSSLTSITIPGSVTSIGVSAFENCYGLESVNIQNGVSIIANGAFYDCCSLMSITIPDSVTIIGNNAFESCDCLADISFSEGLTSIGKWSFSGCAITEITIPDSVTSIGRYAFAYCYSLENAVIPSTITLGSTVFKGCSSLSITILDRTPPSAPTDLVYSSVTEFSATLSWSEPSDNVGVTEYDVYRDGSLVVTTTDTSYTDSELSDGTSYTFTIKAKDAEGNISDDSNVVTVTTVTIDFTYLVNEDDTVTITGYTGSDTNVIIPATIAGKTVTAIDDSAFANCVFTDITIPDGVTSIGDSAFNGCQNLVNITIPESVISIADGAFYDCSGLVSIAIPDGVTTIGNYMFEGCSSLANIIMPSGIISIGDWAFSGCGFTDISIPASVTNIGEGSFYGCESLVSITIPENVTDIGYSAFEGCSSLTSVTIPDSVSAIGEYAFGSCVSLSSIVLPNGITSISDYTFGNCTSLSSVDIPDGVTSIGNWAFSSCSFTSITLPDSLTSIGAGTFYGCDSLSSITIPSGVTSVGNFTFEGCESLINVTIPEGLTSIGDWAFAGCNLTGITLPESVLTLGTGSFSGCGNLTNIALPDGVTDIGNSAFESCDSLTSIVIPDSVESIGEHAFAYCESLLAAIIPSTTIVSETAFEDCHNLTITILDRTPPSLPLNPVAFGIADTFVTLRWDASTDNVGITEYAIYRDGAEIGETTALLYHDSGLMQDTEYSYTIVAKDQEDNVSEASEPVTVHTLLAGQLPPILDDLIVFDEVNSENWTLETDMQAGNTMYTGGDDTFTQIPDYLCGSEWVKPDEASKSYVTDVLFSVYIMSDTEMYILYDADASDTPTWMNGWVKTGDAVLTEQDREFDVYKKRFEGGNTVEFGGGVSSYDMYIVAAKPCMGIGEDLVLNGDMMIPRDLYLDDGTIDLNGYELTVQGSVIQSGGAIDIGEGQMHVNGDYRIQSETMAQDGTIEYSESNGVLIMDDPSGSLTIDGDFIMQYSASLENDPELSLYGDVLVGEDIDIFTDDTSMLDDLQSTRDKTFDINIYSSDLYCEGDATIFADNVKLNGGQLICDGDLYVDIYEGDVGNRSGFAFYGCAAAQVGGNAYVSGDMRVGESSNLTFNGDFRFRDAVEENGVWAYSPTNGVLKVAGEQTYIDVKGDFEFQSNCGSSDSATYTTDHVNQIINGIIAVKGNFYQMQGDTTESSSNFRPVSGANQTCILYGEEQQTVQFDNPNSSTFNILKINKPLDTGYVINAETIWRSLIEMYRSDTQNGQEGVYAPNGNFSTIKDDMTVEGPYFDIIMTRTYNSNNADESGAMGYGWMFGYEGQVTNYNDLPNVKQVVLPDGSKYLFSDKDGQYECEDTRSTFILQSNGYVLTTPNQYKYFFNLSGFLEYIEEPAGNRMTFNLNDQGKPDLVIDEVGRTYQITYQDGHIASITDPADPIGRVVSYTYTDGYLTEVTDPGGNKEYYEYDEKGTLSVIKDHEHNVLESLTYIYDKDDLARIETDTDAYGNTFTYAYNDEEGETTITDSLGRVKTVSFDGAYAIQSETDYEERVTSVTYYQTENGTNLYGEIHTQTDRRGNVTEYNRDDRGNVIEQINPDGSHRVYQYDERNNVTYEEDENGNKTYYEYYNNTNLVTKIIQPINGTDTYVPGGSTEGFVITEYEYYTDSECENLFGCDVTTLIKAVIDGEGNRTEYTYDEYGNQTDVTYPEGNTIHTAFNKIGWPSSETSGEGYVYSYEYDKEGNVLRTILNGGETSRMVYDYAGRMIKDVSAVLYNPSYDNQSTGAYTGDHGNRYTYSPSGLVLQETDAEGNTTVYTYNIYGYRVSEILPNGAVKLYSYDDMNRITQVLFKEDASDDPIVLHTMQYEILANKNFKVTISDYADGDTCLTTEYVYDYAERLISTKQPDETVLTTVYNDNGTVASTTDATGNTTYFDYDGLGNVTGQWVPFNNAGGAMTYSYTSFLYDKADNLVRQREYLNPLAYGTVSGPYIETTNTYDGNGNLLVVADNDGRRTEYQYDLDDQISQKKMLVSPGVYQIETYTNNYFGQPDVMVKKVRAGDLSGNNFNDNTIVDLTTTYQYDANGNLTGETRPDGITITYTYDLLNRLTSTSQPVTDEFGNTVTAVESTTYDFAGNVLTATDRKGNVTENVYDKRGFLIQTIDPMGGVDAFYYDRLGRVIAEVTPENYTAAVALSSLNRKEYTYDTMGRIVTESFTHDDGTGWVNYVSKAYAYDANGNMTKELDALGYAAGAGATPAEKIASGYGTSYTYDCAGNVLSILDPVSQDRGLTFTKRYTYDAQGRMLTEKNAAETTLYYTYDGMDNITEKDYIAYPGGPVSTLAETEYDLIGNATDVTDANGNTTQYQYNAFNNVAQEIQPGDESIDQNTITSQYDSLGNLVRQENIFGTIKLFSFDQMNRNTTKTVRAEDGNDPIVVGIRYDLNGNPRFTVDGNGNITEKTYDANNRLLTESIEVDGVQQTISYTYDANGNQLTATDWLGNTVTAVYDPLNRIVGKWDAEDNRVEKLTYNNNDQQIASLDALDNETLFSYDKNGRLNGTTDAEEHTNSQSYDDKGNVSRKTDANGNETLYWYDALNRLVRVTNALDEETVFTYDDAGNRLTMEDGRGNITSYEYNVRNLMTVEIEPGGIVSGEYVDGLVTRHTYYSNGLLETTEDKNGVTTTYTYDVHGRELSQISGTVSISYTYDDNGNSLTMTDSTGTTTWTYDELNRTLTKQVPVIGTVTYEYDLTAGLISGHRVERSTDPKGNVVEKEFDQVGRLVGVTNDGETTIYEYYDNGSRHRVVYDDGASEEYAYYPDNQVLSLTNRESDGTIIHTYSYTYDDQNNQLSKTDSKGVTSYTYDELNRLATTTMPNGAVTSWSYDEAGNRSVQTVVNGTVVTVDTYTYDTQSRLTEVTKRINTVYVEDTEYTNDDNGNQIQVDTTTYVDGEVDAQTQEIYAYDELNRLTEVNSPYVDASYSYNGDGLRVSKTIDQDTENYLYEGSRVILETDVENTEIAVNVYGINLIQRETDGVKARYMYNGHGDVTALLGVGDTLLASYYYDAFGNISESTGSYNNPYRYSGYRYDEETENYYLAARYYDPAIARFLQEDTYRGDPNDPLSLNLYTYCSNNPIIYKDPSGHRNMDVIESSGSSSNFYIDYYTNLYNPTPKPDPKPTPTPTPQPAPQPDPRPAPQPDPRPKRSVKSSSSKRSKSPKTNTSPKPTPNTPEPKVTPEDLITFKRGTDAITVSRNDTGGKINISIEIYIVFTGDAEKKYKNTGKTYAEIVVDGIEGLLKGNYTGSEYDFYPGAAISVKTKVVDWIIKQKPVQTGELPADIEYPEYGPGEHYMQINIIDEPGRSAYYPNGEPWSPDNINYINIYTHSNKTKSLHSVKGIEYNGAHEMLHALGIGDAYASDDGTRPEAKKTVEVPRNDIMRTHLGIANANTFEMVCEAWKTGKGQSFVTYGRYTKSRVVRK